MGVDSYTSIDQQKLNWRAWNLWKHCRNLREGTPKCSVLEGKWDRLYFKKNLGWWNIIICPQYSSLFQVTYQVIIAIGNSPFSKTHLGWSKQYYIFVHRAMPKQFPESNQTVMLLSIPVMLLLLSGLPTNNPKKHGHRWSNMFCINAQKIKKMVKTRVRSIIIHVTIQQRMVYWCMEGGIPCLPFFSFKSSLVH